MVKTTLTCDFCGRQIDEVNCDQDIRKRYRYGLVSFGNCGETLYEFDACTDCLPKIVGALRLAKSEMRKENGI